MKQLVIMLLLGTGLIAETTVLISSRSTTDLHRGETERQHFCTHYRTLLEFQLKELEKPLDQAARDRAMTELLELSTPPYFELCHVDTTPFQSDVRRIDGCFVAGDINCLTDLGRRILAATPRP